MEKVQVKYASIGFRVTQYIDEKHRHFVEEGNGNPLQYSCLGNPMDRGAWRAAIYRVAKTWTLSDGASHTPTHTDTW